MQWVSVSVSRSRNSLYCMVLEVRSKRVSVGKHWYYPLIWCKIQSRQQSDFGGGTLASGTGTCTSR